MARLPDPVDDRTALDAARIDVAARIGWLLRTHRTTAGLSLRQMSAALGDHGTTLSAPTLSRIESEGQPSPAALDGYARVLGLSEGALRAPADILLRTFPYAPAAPAPSPDGTLAGFDRACEAVEVGAPTGGAWLAFAREHAGGRFGLPTRLVEPHLHRLATEVERSVGVARWTRYEALALLRRSAYADALEDVVRPLVLDPDVQLAFDVMSALSERPTRALLHWCGELLAHDSLFLVRGASIALQSMLVIGGLALQDWAELVPHVERACRVEVGGPERRDVLGRLCAALPAPLQAPLQARLREHGDQAAAPGPRVWSRTRQNVHWTWATSLARATCLRRGHAEEPMLGRLVFEAMFDPRGVRMSSASVLLACSPFSADLVEEILASLDDAPEPAARPAALRVAAFCPLGDRPLPQAAEALLEGEDQDLEHALVMHGRAGRPLPTAAVTRGLAGDEPLVHRTLYALGMAGDPRLQELGEELGEDPTRPDAVRAGARWWVRAGPRILT